MSNARKLQTEIDRVMKKVDEGVELFDEIWEKVYAAEQQNQKEKYEMDLKKEIKKLQRLRDQIKTWIGSSDVKDKDNLLEARKLIETKMEQFKICEKETKTKTYSKEGLAREEKLDPVEEAKLKTTTWIAEYVERFQNLLEEKDFEMEKLQAGRGKKTNKHQIEDLQEQISNHKFHLSKLEGIIRLVNNDRLDVEPVDALKEDLDYYLESFDDEDYMMAYDEEFFYESLGLDELDVVNVDRVTQASVTSKKSQDDATSTSSKGSKDKKGSKKASTVAASVIPITIGRARTKSEKKAEKEREEAERAAAGTPSKIMGRSSSTASTNSGTLPSVPSTKTPAAAPPVPVHTGGASMAAILKRETEQQEKERQKQQLKQQEQLRQQQAQAQLKQQEQVRQQEALRQQQQQQEQLRQQEALRQQQQQEQLRQQEALQRQHQQQQAAQQQAQQEAAAKQQAAQLQAQQQAAAAEQKAQSLQNQQIQNHSNALDILSSGLGGLSLGASDNRSESGSLQLGNAHSGSASASASLEQAGSTYLSALNDSFVTAPGNIDNERSRQYTPQNPYPTPASYPSTPSSIFDNPAVFEKLGTDCLFFIFYYAQGTYQQYLAARELKKQSWRFHKKYMTWFQRHEEPKITTDEYEQGTYVYFDYETGWCTRIKQDFRFEYSYLEDSLQ